MRNGGLIIRGLITGIKICLQVDGPITEGAFNRGAYNRDASYGMLDLILYYHETRQILATNSESTLNKT